MMADTGMEDLDPSIRPIIERAWRAFMDGERLDSVTMTATEFERFWKGLGYREEPAQVTTLYGIPITIVSDGDGMT